MEPLEKLQSEIDRLKREIAVLSCAEDEEALRDIYDEFRMDIKEHYSNSIGVYVLKCFTVPIIVGICVFLFWLSYENIRSWWMRKSVTKGLNNISIVADEISERKLTQAAWRSTRRRVCFFVVIKCFIAVTCIFFFVGMRFLMEASVRVWLRNVLVPSMEENVTAYDSPVGTSNDFNPMSGIRYEVHNFLASLLGLDWVRDLQSVYLFYLFGPGLLAFGLGVMRSAAIDMMALGEKFSLPLDTLKMYRTKKKEVYDLQMQKRVEEVMTKLYALADPSIPLLEEDKRVDDEEEMPGE
ncbi:uncharacterized protein TEOVI_000269800 [Trypanosoma equiperdum]|uniref:Uncharacterized protein n=2 Tax=Trypanozoon TaxID=39700 RepID=Q38AS3_TRYB2|nr:hypothetical protein, conserved [Trypanosoma brucei brucei TREU927]EAN78097.1 hypothetical protein, conserved [Trypanosoma brucei brucei TREU927]SCU71118.1 hypothetical protein, conserved [Trypanosoma equiperdum]